MTHMSSSDIPSGKRTKFYPVDDLRLLQLVRTINPYEKGKGWVEVYETFVRNYGNKFTLKCIRERTQYILDLWRRNDFTNLRRSGTQEEYAERDNLLQEIWYLQQEGKMRKKARKGTSVDGNESRQVATEEFAKTWDEFPADETFAEAEEDGSRDEPKIIIFENFTDEMLQKSESLSSAPPPPETNPSLRETGTEGSLQQSEINDNQPVHTPCTGQKRKSDIRGSVLSFLKERQEEEKKLQERKLALEEREMKLKEEKWEIEKRIMEERWNLEKKEREAKLIQDERRDRFNEALLTLVTEHRKQ